MPFEPRLHARPMQVAAPAPTGLQLLNRGSRSDSHFYVPQQYRPGQPCPLVLMLHGAGGHAHQAIELLQNLADDAGLILVAPASTSHSWDIIVDQSYGPDIEAIDLCLDHVFNRYSVDPARVAMGGFSDGASYGLSLGLSNGDLFTHIIAFSPGFIVPSVQHGRPSVLVSHGKDDQVLPIDRCSRRIVPTLAQAGYDVTYIEFDGGHSVPPRIAGDAVDWFCTHSGGNAAGSASSHSAG